MNSKISVIVPVYNVENYLRRCVSSILNQTYENFEVILVDDGSTDKSGKICDEYCDNNKVLIIHKLNGGLSSARDTGIKASSGDFIIFVDSDDYIEYNSLEILNTNVSRYKYDIIIYGYQMEFINDNNIIEVSAKEKEYNNLQEYISQYSKYRSKGIFSYTTNKMYKASLIKENNVEFGNYVFPEDLYFNFKVLPFCTKIKVIDNILYHYMHQSSLTLSKVKRNKFDTSNEIYDNTIKFFLKIKFQEDNIKYVNKSYIENIISILYSYDYNKNCDEDLKNICNNWRVRAALKDFKTNIVTQKIMYILIKYKLIKCIKMYMNFYVKIKKYNYNKKVLF